MRERPERLRAQFGDPGDFMVIRRDVDPVAGEVRGKLILALPSYGCSYYFERGGCAMCGFNREVEERGLRNLPPSALAQGTKPFLEEAYRQIEEQRTTNLQIFMAGSFFAVDELPAACQEEVLDRFLASSAAKLVVESRADYLLRDAERLRNAAERCQAAGKSLEVSLGLEARNDVLRNRVIRKGLARKTFERACDLLNALGVDASAYVLVGAPGRSGDEAVEEAVETVRYARSCGTAAVHLEVFSVQSRTPWAEAYAHGDWTVPTLWDVVRLVTRLDDDGRSAWYLGHFSDWPEPVAKPDSCERCREPILSALEATRQGLGTALARRLSPCTCAGTPSRARC